MRAIVVGAGIGGVTCSIALRRAGIDVTLLERRPDATSLREGGGMVIWHNALLALRSIDVELGDLGVPLEEMTWRSPTDKPLGSWPVDEMRRRFGVSAIGVTRAGLYARLLAHVPARVVNAGVQVVGFAQDEAGVTATSTDGSRYRGDMLIGADGLGSAIRRQLRGNQPPRYAGYLLDFGIAELDHRALVRGFREYDGRGARLIYFPVGAGRWYWCSIYRHPARGFDTQDVPKGELLRLFRGWPEPLEELIGATRSDAMFGRDGLDRKPVERWSQGRVTLLGDAAHPMTPNLGQGAGQAVEDGVVLAHCLGRAPDPTSALAAYERLRVKRSAYFVKRSHMIGAVGRWQNPFACSLREKLQKRIVPGVAFREHYEKLAFEI